MTTPRTTPKSSTTPRRGRRILAGTVALGLASMIVAPAAMASEVLDFHHRGQLPIAADSSFDSGESCDAGAQQPDGTDGWHFVVPKNGTFDTISVTFDMDGNLKTTDDVETLTEAVQQPDASHAYFYTDPGALLINATATGQGETFNLSHTCAADDDRRPSPSPSPSPSPPSCPRWSRRPLTPRRSPRSCPR